MKLTLKHKGIKYRVNLNKPIDLSIKAGKARCFYAPEVIAEPVVLGDFVGAVSQGAPVNYFYLTVTPHGNGTHTESLGHITEAQESVGDTLDKYHFVAELVSIDIHVLPNGDEVIRGEDLAAKLLGSNADALIIRTLPNNDKKLTKDYTETNPPYLEEAAMKLIVQYGVDHLLLDLPSVDREVDEGKLANHRLFWNVTGVKADKNSRKHATITELCYIPDDVKDGLYLLNLQLPDIDLDALPSRPVLYKMKKKN